MKDCKTVNCKSCGKPMDISVDVRGRPKEFCGDCAYQRLLAYQRRHRYEKKFERLLDKELIP
jgi:hypothetical protein